MLLSLFLSYIRHNRILFNFLRLLQQNQGLVMTRRLVSGRFPAFNTAGGRCQRRAPPWRDQVGMENAAAVDLPATNFLHEPPGRHARAKLPLLPRGILSGGLFAGWGRDLSKTATEFPDSDLPWSEKSVMLM